MSILGVLLGAALGTAVDLLMKAGFEDELRDLKARLSHKDEKKRREAFDRAYKAAREKVQVEDEDTNLLLEHRPFQEAVITTLLDPTQPLDVQATAAKMGEDIPECARALRNFFDALEGELIRDETWGPMLQRYQQFRPRRDVVAALSAQPQLNVPVRDVVRQVSIQFGDGTTLVQGDLVQITNKVFQYFNIGQAPQVPAIPVTDPSKLEAAYLRKVQLSCNTLPLAVIDPRALERVRRQDMDLAAVYVALDTKTPVPVKETKGKRKQPSLESLSAEGRETRPMTALEAADRDRQMVLLGDPGSGKSTFANYLALCLAGARLEELGEASAVQGTGWLALLGTPWTRGVLLPLRITLRHFSKSEHCDGTATGLWSFVEDTLVSQDLGDFAAHLKQRLQNGGVLVLLDGLDEVADPKKRKTVRDAVADFAGTHNRDRNRYLVTCRGYAYNDPFSKLVGFMTHSLAAFTQEQIDAFIDCWYKEVYRLEWKSEAEAKELAQRLQQATRRADLAPLAANPLQLTMMASLHYSWGKLPEDRAELYQEMVRLLLVRWQEGRLGEEEGVTKSLSGGKLVSALEQVAFRAHSEQGSSQGTADVSEALLRSVLKDCAESGSWDAAGTLMTYIQERAGLLIERAPGICTFPHRSYQEYLAGSYLAIQPDFPDQAFRLIQEDYAQWREVVLWAVEIMARLKKMTHVAVNVVEALCPCEVPAKGVTETDWRNARLAGEALLETELDQIRTREPYKSVLARVQKWLVALLQGGHPDPRERAMAGRTLAQLGDPRFRADAWFLPGDDMLGFIHIPAGPFLMGSDKKKDRQAYDGELPQHEVILPEFYIARFPVTVAQFRAFVESKKYEAQGPWQRYSGGDNEPVVSVTWYDARAYCEWLTERLREWKETPKPLAELLQDKKWRVTLPSEAEWEKAARGTDGRIFPWGPEADPNRANYNDTGIGTTSAVGCFPNGASLYGVEDMSGNVWEWTRSLWGKDWQKPTFKYPYEAGDVEREALSADENMLRVLRGGSFLVESNLVRCASRYRSYPFVHSWDVGFRVVLSPVGL